MDRFRVRLLGTTEIEQDGTAVPITAGRLRVLLAVLALRANEVVQRDELEERLWLRHPPNAARATLRGHVKRARKALGRDGPVISSRNGGYLLELDPEAVDVHRFHRLLARSARQPTTTAEAAMLDDALREWRGAALSDVDCDALRHEVVPVLAEQRVHALHRRIDLGLARGERGWIVPRLRRLLAEDPLREMFWEQLMRALAATGRAAEALASYQECREVLAGSLGVDPGARLRSLHERLLAG